MLSTTPAEETVTIPGHDGVQLHARISHALPSAAYADVGAIILHPYGPLGGDLKNNIVRELTATLASLGMSTLRFNMRGVRPSTGSASWTSAAEVEDLRHVVDFWLNRPAGEPFQCQEDGRTWPKVTPKRLIICGYSYGSMVSLPALTHHPAIVAAVLISPPTRYIGVLSLFRSQAFYAKLPAALPKLVIVGDSDSFTSVSGVRSFVETVCGSEGDDPCADVMIVPGYDHFWFGNEDQVTGRVQRWVANILRQ
ncbi:hypothetical protein RI367_001409 [Sorochytrium milnesiophthora]